LQVFRSEEHPGQNQLATLRDFAQERVLLAFDFDGTLAPIVRDPAAAAMRPRTSALLAKVAKLYPCVVISGRSRADVMKKVDAIPLRAVIGNHGMEPSRNLHNARWLAALWHAQLASTLPRIAGVVIEDKGVSLAVHYRQARARAAVRRLILIAAADLLNARIVEGKMVVNVLPAGAPGQRHRPAHPVQAPALRIGHLRRRRRQRRRRLRPGPPRPPARHPRRPLATLASRLLSCPAKWPSTACWSSWPRRARHLDTSMRGQYAFMHADHLGPGRPAVQAGQALRG
jgi:hypothetical protein